MSFDELKKNTVSARGQMADLAHIRFLGAENAGLRILIAGNSITLHGPKASIGWQGDWGMAASAADKDFVHLLCREVLRLRNDAGFCICQASDWETHYWNPEGCTADFSPAVDFGADILVLRLVENCPTKDFQPDIFRQSLQRFAESFGAGHVVATTGFWRHPADESIRQLAAAEGWSLVELGDLGQRDDMKAVGLFAHTGVAAHPGDAGMEVIARRILNALIPII